MEINKKSFYNDPSINLVDPLIWDGAKETSAIIKSALAEALNHGDMEVELSIPMQKGFGDYSTNIAMILAKNRQLNPRELAKEIADKLSTDISLKDIVARIDVAGPGFINFTLTNKALMREMLESLLLRQDYGKQEILAGKRIMFEYAHPNPFKAFHIGHLRNIILGESLIRLLEHMGAEVIRVNYQGDVGMHIAKCLYAFKKIPKEEYPQDVTGRVNLLAKCYAEGASDYNDEQQAEEIKRINSLIYAKTDPEINNLWEIGKQWSLDKFREIYSRVDSSFIREYFESETLTSCLELIEQAVNKGVLEQSEGAIVFKGEAYGLDTRVFLNSQGLPTYEGKELGLASMQFSDYGNIDLNIHNVAVEQISFFKVTFKVEALLDPEKYQGKQYHNAYEFVGLKSGKMSSRTGNVVLGEDILNEGSKLVRDILKQRENFSEEKIAKTAEAIGVGAIKYSFLNISPKSYLAFDLEKSVSFDGNSGPYLQYTYARSHKIVRDAQGYRPLKIADLKNLELNDEEQALLHKIRAFKDVVVESAKHLAPNLLCTYLFDLSQTYNQFYKQHLILKAEEPQRSLRIMLSDSVSQVVETGLYLLGIKVVREM